MNNDTTLEKHAGQIDDLQEKRRTNNNNVVDSINPDDVDNIDESEIKGKCSDATYPYAYNIWNLGLSLGCSVRQS
ncbi:389_t:CDS:2, partial [Entrophospora sp. SA101]